MPHLYIFFVGRMAFIERFHVFLNVFVSTHPEFYSTVASLRKRFSRKVQILTHCTEEKKKKTFRFPSFYISRIRISAINHGRLFSLFPVSVSPESAHPNSLVTEIREIFTIPRCSVISRNPNLSQPDIKRSVKRKYFPHS